MIDTDVHIHKEELLGFCLSKFKKVGDSMYKFVAIDLDGTLLNRDGNISEKNIQAIQKAQNLGIHIVLATGRYFMQTKRIIDQLDFKGILVSNDGTATINTANQALIGEYSFSVEDIASLIHYCRRHHIHFSLCTAFDVYVEWMEDVHEQQYQVYEITPTLHLDVLTLQEKIMKCTIGDLNKVGGWQEIPLAIPERLRRRIDLEFHREYVHAQSNKTKALIHLLDSLDIKQSEMMAIGDYYNDLDMIEFAGLGIAMGNAPDEIKAMANDVTLSNDEDGVFHAFSKYLF
ncbi:Cof-type HAD-IIB family hydrolase [Lederbergia galactosidilytica]|uniref:Uncharacterized protein n=1 Tax=Lederbergia galactosidilytica TaxID=217031 RepID=A0A177ZKX8_9BACI|nr:Cof-type HAD-IIB family hydrolase [Lederbergia galactosidilytica]KRG12580.1 hypothetical protein ACA30_18345 [Virgibacillus soli]OAK68475.1 hypothetical protein ABB05_15460 [Lederbergia galactosidilytica]